MKRLIYQALFRKPVFQMCIYTVLWAHLWVWMAKVIIVFCRETKQINNFKQTFYCECGLAADKVAQRSFVSSVSVDTQTPACSGWPCFEQGIGPEVLSTATAALCFWVHVHSFLWCCKDGVGVSIGCYVMHFIFELFLSFSYCDNITKTKWWTKNSLSLYNWCFVSIGVLTEHNCRVLLRTAEYY